jgi:6-phosphofructokinase 1
LVTLVRESNSPYRCTTGLADVEAVANAERPVPDEFINAEANFVTPAYLEYARPLIGGPLPAYVRFERHLAPKKL